MEFVKRTRKEGGTPVRWKSGEPWVQLVGGGLLSSGGEQHPTGVVPKPGCRAGHPLKKQVSCSRPC